MRYKCKLCGRLSHENACEKCKDIRYMEKLKIPYCNHCNIPVWDLDENGGCKICGAKVTSWYNDLVPVFIQEKILLSVICDKDILNNAVWNLGGNKYLINNKRIIISISKIENVEEIISKYEKLIKNINMHELVIKENNLIEIFVEANKSRFKDIENEGHKYIKEVFNENRNRTCIVSFSGGKDSIVVSDIVRQALAKNDILHIFGNTTLEMDETIEFVNKFKKQNNQIPFIEAKSDKKFIDLCKDIGPPTRIRSWCCSVFKSGPISQILNFINYDKDLKSQKKFLTFYGVRGEESASRNKYGRTSDSPKITSQKVASPVFGWLDYDVWLYILSRKLEFNNAYRKGYRRVGCWCCPNNSKWSEMLNIIYYNKKYYEWKEFLYDFAKKIGKDDYENYIDEGYWKARHGGNGLNNDHTKISRSECIDKRYENIIMQKSYSNQLDEYLKPFGNIQKKVNDDYVEIDVFRKKTGKKLFKIVTKYDSKILKCLVYETSNELLLRKRIDCQIRKYQICIKCSACDSVCPNGAISTLNNNYRIDSNKCIHCLECIAKHFTGGCLMNEVLIKKGD